MIQIKAADHLNFNVINLNESIRWYRELFGFEVKQQGQSGDTPYAIIGLPRVLYLCLYESLKEKPKANGYFNHLGLNISDFEETKKKLQEKGIPILYGGEVDYGKSQSLYIADPNGIEVELSKVFGGGLN